MIGFLNDLVLGWREERTTQGYSYQVSRGGKRRVLPVEDYGRRGGVDEQWLETGEFVDEQIHCKFRDFNHKITRKPLQAIAG